LFHDSGDRWNQIYDSGTKKLNTFVSSASEETGAYPASVGAASL
jgi:hypothetical protein